METVLTSSNVNLSMTGISESTPVLRVLLVLNDLNSIDHSILIDSFPSSKIEVRQSIEQARELISSTLFDVVISELRLKDGHGVNLTEFTDCQLIILLPTSDMKLAVELTSQGADSCLALDNANLLTDLIDALQDVKSQSAKKRLKKEAESLSNELLQNTSDLIFSVNTRQEFLYVNPAWNETLGYKNAERLTLSQIIHEKSLADFDGKLKKLRAGKSIPKVKLWFVTKSGKNIIVEGSLSPNLDLQQNLVSIRGVFSNITDNQIAQLKLKENERKYRVLVESADDIIFYWDPYFRLEYINKKGTEFTGYSEKELFGMHFTELVEKKFVDEFVAFYQKQFYQKLDSSYLEFPILKKNGKKFWVGQTVRTLYNEDDPSQVAGYLGVVRDINEKKILEEQLKMSNQVLEKRVAWRTSEILKTNNKLQKEIDRRIQTEKALIASEKEYKGLFQDAHDALIVFDPETEIILEANEQALKIYGFKREEFIGSSLKNVSENPELGEQRVQSIMQGSGHRRFETVNFTKSGKRMVLEIHANKVTYKGQKAILSINKDITAKREVEQKLREERMQRMSALIDGQEMERKRLSRELHDGLGQLLTASLIYLKQLTGVAENEKAKMLAGKTREIIQDTVEEVRSISHNLMPAVLNDFGLELALRNMIISLNDKFDGTIKFYRRGEIARLRSDVEIGLYRIAQESLNNALKYAQADKINVSLTATEDYQKLTIKDNGVGFDIDSKLSSHTGNGIYNMNQRSKIAGCDFTVWSKPDVGTEITVIYNFKRDGKN